jgi:hypothetical protein
MARRLFVVLAPFTAIHVETGNRRILKADETLFAEPPARSTGVVLFEQDGEEFQVETATFIASTALAKP